VAFPLLALFLAAGMFALTEHENRRTQASLDRSLAVDAQLRYVLRLVVDEETGTRGFLLTRQQRFLEPKVTAHTAMPGALDKLQSLLDGEQRSGLAALRTDIDRRLRVGDEMQRLPAGNASASPALLALLDQGKAATDQVRTQIAAMEKAQSDLLTTTRSRAARARALALGAVIFGATFGLVGGIGSMALFTRGVTRRVTQLERDARLLEAGLPVLAAPAEADDEVGRLGRALARASELLRRRQADLADAQGFLERLLSAGPAGVIRVTLPDLSVVYASPNLERLFGVSVAQALTPGFLRDRVHPEDLPSVQGEVDKVTDGTAAEARAELRFLAGNDRYCWISVLFVAEMDDAGRPTGLLAYLLDIDDRRGAETALQEREATLRAVFDASPDIITITGLDNTLHSANAAMQRVLGYDPVDLLGQRALHLVHPDDQEAVVEASRRMFASHGDHIDVRYRARHADGRWVVLETQGSIMYGAEEEPEAVVAVTRDVTERVRLEQLEQQARETAEAANRAKSEFLSRMSHELRTPLNAVLGFAQLLELEDLSPEQQEAVAHILKGGRHLVDLIDEVLDISRIESGRLNLSPEPVPVDDLLADTLDLIRPLATQHGIHLLGFGAKCGGYILADRQRLKQVILNLLSNAIKYNHPGGTVSLSCEAAGEERLRIEVADTGPGIRPEHLPLLFTPFERLGAEQTGVEGSGIGLALSRRLTEAMGGLLDVVTAVGQGSTFRVELPAAEGPLERYERLNGGASAPEAPLPPRRGKVLLIEDNLANVKLVERILAQRVGVEIVAAMQGRLGLELAREHRPQLILLDLHLPDLNGDEVLRRLRDHPATAAIPVVMVSADATRGEVQRLLAAGAAHYLTKPLDVRQLLHILDEVLVDGQGQEGPES
jgi:PAS domain S-box-containing protein